MQKCPECKGLKKTKTGPLISRDSDERSEEECALCGGTGYVEEDLMPLVIGRLDRIIKLLKEIKAGGK